MIFVSVFYRSWRNGWKQTSYTSPCVTLSLDTVSASKWFMCPTSPTSPIRTPPTRDSCKPFSQAFKFSYYLFYYYLSKHSIFLFLSGMRTQGSDGLWRNQRGVPSVRGFLSAPSSSFPSRGSQELSCWSRCVSVCAEVWPL